MPSCRLALAIPTFERSGAVAVNLPRLLEEAAGLGVHVYLSDDSRDGETEGIARALAERHSNLHYRRNTPSHGHDRNVVATVTWPDADYVWVLGDVFRTRPGGLARVLGFLDDQDFVFVNWQSDDKSLRRHVSEAAATALLRDRLWHQALTGATLYSRRVIDWVKESHRDYHRNFPQLGIILGYAEAHPLTLGWFGTSILQAEVKKSYWTHRALDVFVDDWGAVIADHPRAIPPADFTRVVKSHSANTRLFDAKFLYRLRESGNFGATSLRRRYFWPAMHLSPVKVVLLLALPKSLCRRLLGIAPTS